jgi:hypothetical protein
MAKMLIASQAANCRRVESKSRSATHFAIDDRCQHLALQAAEKWRLAKVKMAIQGSCRPCDSEIDRKNLKHAGHNTSILTTNPMEEELSDSTDLLRHDCHDVWHSSSLSELQSQFSMPLLVTRSCCVG